MLFWTVTWCATWCWTWSVTTCSPCATSSCHCRCHHLGCQCGSIYWTCGHATCSPCATSSCQCRWHHLGCQCGSIYCTSVRTKYIKLHIHIRTYPYTHYMLLLWIWPNLCWRYAPTVSVHTHYIYWMLSKIQRVCLPPSMYCPSGVRHFTAGCRLMLGPLTAHTFTL